MIAWFNGEFLAKEKIVISPEDRGFLFADGLYEVIRCYKSGMFQAKEHFERLNYGARQLCFTEQDFKYLYPVCLQLLEKNGLQQKDATLYIQITRGVAPRKHRFPVASTEQTIYIVAQSFDPAPSQAAQKSGIAVITVADSRWARCDIKTTALTANILANQRAVEAGAEEALLVRDGVILEGSHSNFAAVCDGVLVTAPLSNYILGGITRQVVLEVARGNGIPVEECPIFCNEISKYSEFMTFGTTTEITPVIKIDGKQVGNGKKGDITAKLQWLFVNFIHNEKKMV